LNEDLAARPEYAEPLREEIMEVLGTGHEVTKASLAKLKKMDSFIRVRQPLFPPFRDYTYKKQESGRLNGSMLVTSRRIALHDIVLSNGELIPAGTQTSLPVHDQLNDVPFPDVFDGFRWYNLRKEKPENENKFQFSESGRNSLYWGSGKHACYGRFFASDMIKCLLVIILREYDVALPEGKGRPESWRLDWKVVPNISAEILMRQREV
jgi:cytochrome P450